VKRRLVRFFPKYQLLFHRLVYFWIFLCLPSRVSRDALHEHLLYTQATALRLQQTGKPYFPAHPKVLSAETHFPGRVTLVIWDFPSNFSFYWRTVPSGMEEWWQKALSAQRERWWDGRLATGKETSSCSLSSLVARNTATSARTLLFVVHFI